MTKRPKITHDANLIEYSQLMADIISIFGHFHKARLDANDLKPAYFVVEDRFVPYDITQDAQEFGEAFMPLERFSTAYKEAIDYSRRQFIGALGLRQPASYEIATWPDLPISDSARVFIHPYVSDLAARAQELRSLIGHPDPEATTNIHEITEDGLRFGAEITGQLAGLFGDDFSPSLTTRLARVYIRNTEEIQEGLGLVLDNPTYDLLDASPVGLNSDTLKSWGWGEAVGCPAALPPTEKTKDFLRARGVKDPIQPMLYDFSRMFNGEFNRTVRTWFNGLNEGDRTRFVHHEDLRILTGKARGAAIAQSEARCPYRPGGKER
jgi:hypothetical protein